MLEVPVLNKCKVCIQSGYNSVWVSFDIWWYIYHIKYTCLHIIPCTTCPVSIRSWFTNHQNNPSKLYLIETLWRILLGHQGRNQNGPLEDGDSISYIIEWPVAPGNRGGRQVYRKLGHLSISYPFTVAEIYILCSQTSFGWYNFALAHFCIASCICLSRDKSTNWNISYTHTHLPFQSANLYYWISWGPWPHDIWHPWHPRTCSS